MTFEATYIQQPAPAKRGLRAGDFASDLPSLRLHSGQHRLNGGRDRNAERFASSTLGAWESQDAVFQIHAVERDLRLTQSASSSQGNLKTDSHPFGHTFNGQSLPGDFNFILRKDRFNACNRPPLNSVIQKSDRIHLAQQSALAVNPFKNLQILTGLVTASLTAGRAWEALAPSQINFTIGWRKRLQSYFFLTNKTSKMTPAIPVVHLCQRGNWVIFNQIVNPIAAAVFTFFINAKSSGLSRCLRAVKGIVDSVAGAFCAPLARRIFKANVKPRIAFLNVGIGHSYKGNIWAV